MRRLSPHDTCSTARSHLRTMRFSREIIEVALNHELRRPERIYDVREEMPRRLSRDGSVGCFRGRLL